MKKFLVMFSILILVGCEGLQNDLIDKKVRDNLVVSSVKFSGNCMVEFKSTESRSLPDILINLANIHTLQTSIFNAKNSFLLINNVLVAKIKIKDSIEIRDLFRTCELTR